jgi:hypothetical protein
MTRNACHNRAPFAETMRIQAGWSESGPTRFPAMKEIPFRNSRECVYGKDVSEDARRGKLGAFDPGCAGCGWKAETA